MKQHYTHLTQEERYHIHAYKAAGFSNIFIAEELDRHESTIKRELGRNPGLRGYKPKQAYSFAQSRLVLKPKHVKMTPDMIERIKQGQG